MTGSRHLAADILLAAKPYLWATEYWGQAMPRTVIAVLSDAHANLPALRAALDAIEREGCDGLYHTGDAIGIGPFPSESLELLLGTTGMQLLMGNHDAWFAHGLPDLPLASMSAGEVTHRQWTHAQLAPSLRPVVATWPYALHIAFGDTTVTFAHYGLDRTGRDFAAIVQNPRPVDLDRLFAGETSRLICYGHHHPPDDQQGRARYINPGALGCSTDGLARYALLEFDGRGGAAVRHRAVPYDVETVFRAFEERQVPERETIRRIFFGKGS